MNQQVKEPKAALVPEYKSFINESIYKMIPPYCMLLIEAKNMASVIKEYLTIKQLKKHNQHLNEINESLMQIYSTIREYFNQYRLLEIPSIPETPACEKLEESVKLLFNKSLNLSDDYSDLCDCALEEKDYASFSFLTSRFFLITQLESLCRQLYDSVTIHAVTNQNKENNTNK